MKYVIVYKGPIGFMKPWTAVRDSLTKSNDFLTTSILMGIERKIFPELLIDDNGELNKIKRHRLDFGGISFQQETTLSYSKNKPKTSTIKRGLLINPVLYLLFDKEDDADVAYEQCICLSRNEDILMPYEKHEIESESEFDNYDGYESFISDEKNTLSIYCGLNKYTNDKQFIIKRIYGEPTNLI